MKLKDIRNLTTIQLIENATELFGLKKYYSKDFVEKFLGLALQRSSFYGVLKNDSVIPLNNNKVVFDQDTDVTLQIEGILVLDKIPVNNGSGEIIYSGYGVLEVDDVVIYDGRNNIGGEPTDVYDGPSPTTTTVGDLAAGTDITGLTAFEIIAFMTNSYQVPSFTSFFINGQSSLVEVGTVISGSQLFGWTTENTSNIQEPGTIEDITNSGVLASNVTVSGGSAILDVGTITFSAEQEQRWRISAQNTENDPLSRDYTVNSIYPYFYGTVQDSNSPGVNRPTANQALIDSGNKVIQSSSGNLEINWNSNADDYVWFAVPSTIADKTAWVDLSNPSNNGAIGGAVSAGGNLFPDPDTVSITTVNWSGVNYDIYISNFQTSFTTTVQIS